MNTKAIHQALNADLRGSWPALQRAARRARELAAQTGTDLIVSHSSAIERIEPPPEESAGHQVQESLLAYKGAS